MRQPICYRKPPQIPAGNQHRGSNTESSEAEPCDSQAFPVAGGSHQREASACSLVERGLVTKARLLRQAFVDCIVSVRNSP